MGGDFFGMVKNAFGGKKLVGPKILLEKTCIKTRTN